MANRYLVAGGSGVWSGTNNWSTTSGGTSGASAPGSGDTAYLNAASGSASIAISANTSVGILDMTGFTGTFGDNGHIMQISLGLTNGYLTYGTGMTLTLTGVMQPANTSGTCTFTDLSGGSVSLYTVRGPSTSGANFNFGSNITVANAFVLYSGNVNTQGYNLTAGYVSNSASGFTFNFSNSTITLTGSISNSWNPGTGSITSTGSTITYPAAGPTNAPTFTGGGYTYNNLTWNYTGSGAQTLTISGNNTFNNVTLTTTASSSKILFPTGVTTTITTLVASGTASFQLSLYSATASTRAGVVITNTPSVTYTTFSGVFFTGAGIPVNATGTGNLNVGGTSGVNFNANYDVIQSRASVSTGGSITTSTLAITTGHTIILAITENATGNTWAISDTAGNTYVQAVTKLNSTLYRSDIWYAKNCLGNAANAITITGGTGNMGVVQYEAIGLDLSSPVDKTMVGASTSTNPVTAASGTLSQAQEIVLSVLASADTSTGNISAAGGYELGAYGALATNYSIASAYKTVNATTTTTAGFTDGTSAVWAIAAATFKHTASSHGSTLAMMGVG